MANVYVMNAKVKIGKIELNYISSASIESSIKSLSDTAVLVLPRNIAELNSRRPIQEFIQIDHKVEIWLGYNDQLFKEFEGYIKNISANEPLELECEDEMYILRKKKLEGKHHKTIQLSALLKEIVGEYKLVFDYDFELVNFRIAKDVSAFNVLEHLKENFPVDFYFKRNESTDELELHSGWTYSLNPKKYQTYILEQNVVKNDLKYIVGTARKVLVKMVGSLKNGKKVVAEWGDADARAETIEKPNVTDKDTLERMAKAETERRRYSGFDGKITGFLFPRTKCGEGLEVKSSRFPDRNGKYLIDGVKIEFSESGGRRTNEISKKLTNG